MFFVIVRICIDIFLYYCFIMEIIFVILKNILICNLNLNVDVILCKNSVFELLFLRR